MADTPHPGTPDPDHAANEETTVNDSAPRPHDPTTDDTPTDAPRPAAPEAAEVELPATPAPADAYPQVPFPATGDYTGIGPVAPPLRQPPGVGYLPDPAVGAPYVDTAPVEGRRGPSIALLLAGLAAIVVAVWALIGPGSPGDLAFAVPWVALGAAVVVGLVLVLAPTRRRSRHS